MCIYTAHAMVYTRFSHLVLSFGSSLLLLCPAIIDYKVAQLYLGRTLKFEISVVWLGKLPNLSLWCVFSRRRK